MLFDGAFYLLCYFTGDFSGRPNRRDERKINTETFGVGGGYNRGRGNYRGYRGSGNYRGNRGGYNQGGGYGYGSYGREGGAGRGGWSFNNNRSRGKYFITVGVCR